MKSVIFFYFEPLNPVENSKLKNCSIILKRVGNSFCFSGQLEGHDESIQPKQSKRRKLRNHHQLDEKFWLTHILILWLHGKLFQSAWKTLKLTWVWPSTSQDKSIERLAERD
jgi:hypothetical protein